MRIKKIYTLMVILEAMSCQKQLNMFSFICSLISWRLPLHILESLVASNVSHVEHGNVTRSLIAESETPGESWE